MSVLRSIEGSIERLFEGVFGRAFRTHVQPVELARKLAKEMDEHRSVSVSRVYVPNEYSVYLSPADRQQFVSLRRLARRRAAGVPDRARAPRGLRAPDAAAREVPRRRGSRGRRVRHRDPRRPAGGRAPLPARGAPPAKVSIPARSHPLPHRRAGAAVAVPEAAAPAITMIYPSRDWPDATPTQATRARAGARGRHADGRGRAHPITSRSFVIGRSRECDLSVTRRQRVPPARRGRARGGRVLRRRSRLDQRHGAEREDASRARS